MDHCRYLQFVRHLCYPESENVILKKALGSITPQHLGVEIVRKQTHRHLFSIRAPSQLKVKKLEQNILNSWTHFFLDFYQPSYFELLFTKNYKLRQCGGHMLQVNGTLFLLAFSLSLAGFPSICHLAELILQSWWFSIGYVFRLNHISFVAIICWNSHHTHTMLKTFFSKSKSFSQYSQLDQYQTVLAESFIIGWK